MHQGLPELDVPQPQNELPTPTLCPVRQRVQAALGDSAFRFFPDQGSHHFLLCRPERLLNVDGLVASLNGTVKCRMNTPHTLHLIGDGGTIAQLIETYRH